MTAGIPIRVRRTISDTPIDPIQLGGLLWHINDQKLGVFNGTQMAWYPGVDATNRHFILNDGQVLTGIDENGDESLIGVSFDTPGEMRIINTSNNNVLARFTANGAVSFANPQTTGVLPGGSTQKISHPGFIPGLFRTKKSDNALGFVGPNTYLWKKSDATGIFEVSPTYKEGSGGLTHSSAEQYTLKVSVTNDPTIQTTGTGLRTWLFDTSLSSDSEFTNNHRVYISYFGPLNGSNTIRIGREGTYLEKEILGTGGWTREYIDIPNHLISDDYSMSVREPFAIDLFYKTTPGDWYVAEPSIQNVDVVTTEVYQYRTLVERMVIADAYYWEPPTQLMDSNKIRQFNLPIKFPTLTTHTTYTVEPILTDRPFVVSQQEKEGFRLQGTSSVEGTWNAKFAVGYHGRLNDIT